jgi:AraC-like DNA-binding protein
MHTTNKQQHSNGQLSFLNLRSPTDCRIELLCRRLADDSLCGESCARDAAQALNISTSRFRHVFKQETGLPFARFVKLVRLHRARKLLLETRLRIKEVAANTGFNDVSHFVKDFKSVYGESPARLRITDTETRLL